MKICLLFLVIATLFLSTTNSFQIDLKERQEKCISEEIEHDSLVTGSYSLVEPKQLAVDLIIYDSKHHTIFHKHTIEDGKFAFRTDIHGDYKFCFTSHRQQSFQASASTQRIEFEFKMGSEARDYSDIATKEHLNPLETEIRKMQDLVLEIHEEILYSKNREEAMRNTNESTNARVLWFSILSIIVLVGTGVMPNYKLTLPNVHFHKDWKTRVKTWFDQPARKTRRKQNRIKKAIKVAPRPASGSLRPIVHCQTQRYNMRIKSGRGFTHRELKMAGISRHQAMGIENPNKQDSKRELQKQAKQVKTYMKVRYPERTIETRVIPQELRERDLAKERRDKIQKNQRKTHQNQTRKEEINNPLDGWKVN
ncbi:transmembrane emp24 domain-containing protein [Anaeramoeba flamelloides]|uniref:Transmembrane emp24 domain-containing protein n=1 Tax=Anaeramoeba flamelloides TaxID=1746091 RepID=A0AAV7Y6U9_9EUKA|nr:transmembrane emp24 domain-containing protein [Anaeramoeba flamelloides]